MEQQNDLALRVSADLNHPEAVDISAELFRQTVEADPRLRALLKGSEE